MKDSSVKILSALLALIMLSLMLPIGAFSASAATEMETVNMFIGPTPSNITAEQKTWKQFDSLYDAELYYDWSTSYKASDERVHYICHVTDDITETGDWGDNLRRTITVKAWTPDVSTPENNPTITVAVRNGAKSAWLLTGGNDNGDITFENINVTLSAEGAHYGAARTSDRAIFGVSAFTKLTLNNVILIKDVAAKDSFAIAMRSDVAESLTFKGKCQFLQRSSNGTLTQELNWLGGFTNRTVGAEKYTVNFDGATISTGSVNVLTYTSNLDIDVNIINGSRLTVSTGYIFKHEGTGNANIHMSDSTVEATGNGRIFSCIQSGSSIELDINNSYLYAKNATSTGQMFLAQGGTTETAACSITGTVKNSILEHSSTSGSIVRTTGTSQYVTVDLTFENCKITASKSFASIGGSSYGNINLAFIGGSVTVGGKIIESTSAENANISITVSADTKLSAGSWYLYNTKASTSTTVMLDGYQLSDSLTQQLSMSESSASWYYPASADFTLILRNCYTDVASTTGTKETVTSNILHTIGASSKATTYNVVLENTTFDLGNAHAFSKDSAANYTSFNIKLIDSKVTTASTKMFTNGVASTNIKIDIINSTLSTSNTSTATTVADHSAIFSFSGATPAKSLELNIRSGKIDGNKGYVIFNDLTGDSNTTQTVNINIYGGELVSGTKVINAVGSTEKVLINVYGGSLTGKQYSGIRPLGVMDLRGINTVTNIYGGDISATYVNANTGSSSGTDVVMISAMWSSVNIFGGNITYNNDNNLSQMLRHAYKNTVSSSLVVSPQIEGAQNTALKIYGGTFVTNQGAVLSAGTSTTDKCYGNVYVYGGTFVKTGSSASGHNIMSHRNNHTSETTTSNIISNNNYNILGGVWISPDNDITAYKYASSSDTAYVAKASKNGILSTYAKGALNKQANNINVTANALTEENYSSYGITNETWELVKHFSNKDAIAIKNSAEEYLTGVELIGSAYLQISNGTTSISQNADLRVLFEMNKTVANDPNYTEFGFFVSTSNSKPLGNESGVATVKPSSCVLYSAVRDSSGYVWRPDNTQNSIAILNVNNVTNEYFTNPEKKIYVTAYVKSASGALLCGEAVAIDVTSMIPEQVGIPYFETKGTFAENIYNCGSHFNTFYNDQTDGDSLMFCVNGSTQQEVDAYVTKLQTNGYRLVSEMKPELAYFARLTNGTKSVIVAFENSAKVARIIVEEGVATPEDISYTVTASENNGAVFYQFGLLNDTDDNTTGAQTHGMCYIIRLADNSVIVIDGGIQAQMQGNNGDYSPAAQLDAFLHEITGTPSNEKATIACWYLSHGHDDHYGGFLEFIKKYHAKYDLKTVMANLPDNGLNAPTPGATGWHNCINNWTPVFEEYYPDCVFYKPHTGDKVQFADVTIEVLFTHEDLVDPVTGKTLIISDFNDTSTVTKISTNGMSMIIMGDASTLVEAKLPKYYTSYIKADIVQLAHHGANAMPNTYALIKATHIFVPTCIERTTGPMYQEILASASKYASTSNIYYSGSFDKTVGLAYRNGQITKVYP